MSEAILPKIKVIDVKDGSAPFSPPLDSPTTADGATSPRPRSATSSEGTIY